MDIKNYKVYISGKSIADVRKAGAPKIKEELASILSNHIEKMLYSMDKFSINEIIITRNYTKPKIVKYKTTIQERIIKMFGGIMPMYRSYSLHNKIITIHGRKYKVSEVGE